jgi:hypothetical protein
MVYGAVHLCDGWRHEYIYLLVVAVVVACYE